MKVVLAFFLLLIPLTSHAIPWFFFMGGSDPVPKNMTLCNTQEESPVDCSVLSKEDTRTFITNHVLKEKSSALTNCLRQKTEAGVESALPAIKEHNGYWNQCINPNLPALLTAEKPYLDDLLHRRKVTAIGMQLVCLAMIIYLGRKWWKELRD